jgi:hypothetical protein
MQETRSSMHFPFLTTIFPVKQHKTVVMPEAAVTAFKMGGLTGPADNSSVEIQEAPIVLMVDGVHGKTLLVVHKFVMAEQKHK